MDSKTDSEAKPRVSKGEPVRTWGGWYRHDVVTLAGLEIGRIQTRRRNGRVDVMTVRGGACVLGADVAWLLRENSAVVDAVQEENTGE